MSICKVRRGHARMVMLATIALLGSVPAAPPARADVSLPALFAENMVLQQQTKAPIWGWAKPGEEVRITATWPSAAPATATADAHGHWRTELNTPAAGGPFELAVSGNNTIRLANVMVGEVWLCSGQSNIEWPLQASDGADAAIAAAIAPRIRLFTVANTMSVRPLDNVQAESTSPGHPSGWLICSPAAAKNFSAVGYHFGRELSDTLSVPVGLIAADWGGTPAQSWMSADALSKFPPYAPAIDYLRAVSLDPNQRDAGIADVQQQWWDGLDTLPQGAGATWAAPDFDDSSWATTSLPATFSGELAGFDGIVYYRRHVELPTGIDTATPVTLELGPIDDRDDAFINGVHVGGLHDDGQWGVARTYEVPAGVLKPGRNTVAVRVYDTSGPGGMNGKPEQLALRLANLSRSFPLAGEWRTHTGAPRSALPAMPQVVQVTPHTPSILYNSMIAPLAPFALRGVIWYQGESNRADAAGYASLFQALIQDWRRAFNRELPFGFVQIAPFNYGDDRGQTAELRESQAKALSLPNTGMVVTMDIGNPADIHPRNKRDVGHRLALWALANQYGKSDLEFSGPRFKSASTSGNSVQLHFDHAAGLTSRNGPPSHLLIAGEDRVFHPATATIDGETLIVRSDKVSDPKSVRYAWESDCQPNLVSGAGLPAAPFRTDDWERPAGGGGWKMADSGSTPHLTTDPAFTPIFNGTDLSGWVNVNGAPSTWTVKDNAIACSGTPIGVLRTAEQYENFILEVEWRHLNPQANAGIFVWSDALTARGQPFTRSVEVQVMDGMSGDGYTSDGDIFPIHGARMTPVNGRAGSDRAFPTERRMRPSPQWNHYRITCDNGAISLAVNGKEVTTGKDISPRKGYICLESEGSPIEFRNIRIRKLQASPKLAPEQIATQDEGFVPLYNGVDLTGWKVGPEHEGHFKADNWTIAYDGQGSDLWTDKSYKDFVLICDWRWTAPPKTNELPIILPSGDQQLTADGKPATAPTPEAGDSGIYLRGSSKAQVNIWCWPIGSGEIDGYRTDAALPADVRAAVTPKLRADAPIGQWNRFEITMKGEHVTVVLNGKTVIENAHLPGVAAEGPIALQQHNTPIQFANIYIKELR
ncbi:MAG: DUF1080 domain-containing protein [Phycisphaerales bacterium]|nr:DUF1080 domain-containing protein [Phycisphaerales bacterium]